MTSPDTTPHDHRGTLQALWSHTPGALDELNTECSPTKTCRNMKDINFDGYADNPSDLHNAWRTLLEQEGKLGPSTVNDLVNGTTPDNR